jgi:3-hydroxybutyryl-CoA dehydrogenase
VNARVSATTDLDALADCDLVLESVVEDIDVKKQLIADLDRVVRDGAILATNTSTLPVVELAVETQRPERFVGLHFFNPAPAMGLVGGARWFEPDPWRRPPPSPGVRQTVVVEVGQASS